MRKDNKNTYTLDFKLKMAGEVMSDNMILIQLLSEYHILPKIRFSFRI